MNHQALIDQALEPLLRTHNGRILEAINPKSYQFKPQSNLLQLNFCCHSKQPTLHQNLAKQINLETIKQRVRRHQIQPGAKGIASIKNVIAVGSGKGGVGKSSISVGLAQALVSEGARVGLLDADIYGPSLPTMLGITDKPTSPDGKSMNPIEVAGVKTISIGYLTEADTPMIWRGPIVTNTLKQLLAETNWGGLDYLIIDLPPGTGDIQLTLAQHIPVTAALLVTTPQQVALADAKKAIRMFERVNIHLLGVVENMAYLECFNCQQKHYPFGQGGGDELSHNYQTQILLQLPLDADFSQLLDEGKRVHQHPKYWNYFQQLARRVSYEISLRPIDFTAKMPEVQVTNLSPQ